MTHEQIPLFSAPGAKPAPAAPPRERRARASRHVAAGEPDKAAFVELALPLAHAVDATSPPCAGTSAERPPALAAPIDPVPLLHAIADTDLPMPMPTDIEAASLQHVSATDHAEPEAPVLRTDRLWQLDGWTARVIKNEDDDGWAVEMLQDGEAEPALVGPWTMGRDKKNPKPLDQTAFNTLVKTVSEVLQRHRQQAHAMLHKRLTVFALNAQWEVRLDITPDEYEPYATLSALDEAGDEVAAVRVPADFRLGVASATAWITSGFARPAVARGSEGWSA